MYNLKIFLDLLLLLKKQLAAVARIYLVYQSHSILHLDPLPRITHALVTFKLDYCNVFCMRLSLETSWKLQLVHNIAFGMVIDTPQCELNWLPVSFLVEFKVLW